MRPSNNNGRKHYVHQLIMSVTSSLLPLLCNCNPLCNCTPPRFENKSDYITVPSFAIAPHFATTVRQNMWICCGKMCGFDAAKCDEYVVTKSTGLVCQSVRVGARSAAEWENGATKWRRRTTAQIDKIEPVANTCDFYQKRNCSSVGRVDFYNKSWNQM